MFVILYTGMPYNLLVQKFQKRFTSRECLTFSEIYTYAGMRKFYINFDLHGRIYFLGL
jgi:hypothetical protein